MEIKSGNPYPANALSNFAPHSFTVDGVACASMEGFLQSLKFKNPEMQKAICRMVGLRAKRAGANKNWQVKQVLYWQGVEYKRDSKDYQILLDKAYRALSQNEKFRKALKASGTSFFHHSIGRNKKNKTVLTEAEFCTRLHELRYDLYGV